MKSKSILWLALAVVVLGLFAWFVDRDRPGSKQRRERADRILEIEADQVQRLVLGSGDSEMVLEREPTDVQEREDQDGGPVDEARWWLRQPIEARADEAKVSRIVQSLADLDRSRRLDDIALADYGLGDPQWRLQLVTDERSYDLAVGDRLPGLDQVAISLGDGAVDLVPDTWLDQLESEPTEWRSERLFWQTRDQIQRVSFSGGDQVTQENTVMPENTVTLERDTTTGFRLTAPLDDLADRSLVDSLLATILGLRADAYLDDSPVEGPEPMDSDDSEALTGVSSSLLVELEDGETWRASWGGGNQAANQTGSQAVVDGERVRLDISALDEAATRGAGEWRSPTWSPVQGYDVDRALLIDAEGEIQLAKVDGDWQRDGEPISFSAATEVLYAMSEARADSFEQIEASSWSDDPSLAVTLTTEDQERVLELYSVTLPERGCLATADNRPGALRLSAESCDKVLAGVATLRQAEPIGAAESSGDQSDG